MSKADEIFIKNARDILEHGTDTKGQKVRPRWKDGSSAYTIKHFGVCDTFDLSEKGEFPAVTQRKTGIKGAWDEMLWIFKKKSNNIHDFSLHIWDDWADETGSIRKAYGYQIGKPTIFRVLKTGEAVDDAMAKLSEINLPSSKIVAEFGGRVAKNEGAKAFLVMDQTDAVLYQLKFEPFSRRIMTSMWNVEELTEMGLQPCCWNLTFNVTDENRPDGKLTLNAVLNQRSNDMLAAYNWNTCQYAVLLMAFAQVSGMAAGKLMHVIVDQHIYDRHVDIVKELIERPTYPAPKVWLDPSVTDFYQFTKDSLHVEDYQAGEQVTFEVAV